MIPLLENSVISEINELKRILSEIPEENIIERKSFEGRLEYASKYLEQMRELANYSSMDLETEEWMNAPAGKFVTKLVAEPKWIKCNDRMPEPRTSFLAYARVYREEKFKIIHCSYYDSLEMKGRTYTPEFFEECDCSGYDFDHMKIEEVTHWMPLPQPPKEE